MTKHFASVVGAVALIAAVFVVLRKDPIVTPSVVEQPMFESATTTYRTGTEVIETTRFVPETIVDRGIASARTPSTPCGNVRGGLVNHHTLAPDLLAGFFLELARCAPRATRFILLSPDHWQGASAPLMTGRMIYHVGERTIPTDEAGIDRLQNAVPVVIADAQPFVMEHGVGALIPFLARTHSDATVLPIIVSGKLSSAESEVLVNWLRTEVVRSGTLLIVSTDLSHYLDLHQALQNDDQTLRALEGSDHTFFDRVNDDFTDNGTSLSAAIQALAPSRFTLLQRGHSVAYGGSPGYTTTYATGLWR
jgi:AmmeMemoRadiSam system protein B